jgi:hypothetical protein
MEAEPGLLPLLTRWLPLLPYPEDAVPNPDGAVVRVSSGASPFPPPATRGDPALRLGTVDAWVDAAAGRAALRGAAGCAGEADLAALSAELRAPEGPDDAGAAAWDLYSMSTLVCALLLGRMGRALAHAAAVVPPGGGAWLLVGDTHAGKTTTVVNLIGAGWSFVTDDHGVLSRGASGALAVEGWPRPFHLDEGWESGAPVGRRGAVDPLARWPGQWLRSAPLSGLLFPRVEAGLATELSPLAASAALAGLLRQSPWLLADRGAAPAVLDLLRAVCELPAFSLRLGLDTYRDAERLVEVLRPVVGA